MPVLPITMHHKCTPSLFSEPLLLNDTKTKTVLLSCKVDSKGFQTREKGSWPAEAGFKRETGIQLLICGTLPDISPFNKVSVQIVFGTRPVKHLKAWRQIHEALLRGEPFDF